MDQLLSETSLIPLVTVTDARQVLPLADALSRGGLDVIEIALRSDAALEAIEIVRRERPRIVVGAGTVRSVDDLQRAAGAGASFVVTPGVTPELAMVMRDLELPLLPGAASPSEVMALREMGFFLQKLFPIARLGGTRYLQDLSGPFPDVRFIPSGGVGADDASAYLALDNVLAVSGSWMAPRSLIEREAWSSIESLARDASLRIRERNSSN